MPALRPPITRRHRQATASQGCRGMPRRLAAANETTTERAQRPWSSRVRSGSRCLRSMVPVGPSRCTRLLLRAVAASSHPISLTGPTLPAGRRATPRAQATRPGVGHGPRSGVTARPTGSIGQAPPSRVWTQHPGTMEGAARPNRAHHARRQRSAARTCAPGVPCRW